jgi:hypothetical protein
MGCVGAVVPGTTESCVEYVGRDGEVAIYRAGAGHEPPGLIWQNSQGRDGIEMRCFWSVRLCRPCTGPVSSLLRSAGEAGEHCSGGNL